jgi:hypothetical protein
MQKWGKHIWDIIKGLAAWIISLGISAMIGWLAWLKDVPAYLIILAILAAVGLIIFIINQYYNYRSERKKSLSKLSDKKIEKTIRDWLDIPGYNIEKMRGEENIFFNYLLKDKIDRKVNIIRAKEEQHLISFIGKVIIDPPRSRPLTDFEWRKLSGKISIDMARFGIEYDFTGSTNRYDSVTLLDRLVLDNSLNDIVFRQRILFVIRAIILVIEIYNQFLFEIDIRP